MAEAEGTTTTTTATTTEGAASGAAASEGTASLATTGGKPAEGAKATEAEGGKPAAEGEDGKEGKDGKTDKPKDGVPEKYEFTLPEGTELDPAKVEAFTPIAKELNLTNEQAQKLVDFYANEQKNAYEAQMETWRNTTKGWEKSTREDKEIGGQNFDANLGVAMEALNALDPIPSGQKSTPFRDMMDATGTGNHPEQLRMLVRVGTLIKDHKIVFGNAAGAGETDPAKKLFPNQA